MTKSLAKLTKEVEYLQGEVTRLLRVLNEAEQAQAAERQAMKASAQEVLRVIDHEQTGRDNLILSKELRAHLEQMARS